MTTDDFVLEQVERSQRQRTRRRRDDRSKRRRVYGVVALLLMAALVAGAPSLISHSSVGRSMLAQALAEYGWTGEADAMRIGWVTPLRITGLEIQGEHGSHLSAAQLDMDLTISDLLRTGGQPPGHCSIRGIAVSCSIGDGHSTLEQDLQALLSSPDNEGAVTCRLEAHDISVAVTDAATGETWQISKSNADIDVSPKRIQATFAGVLSEPQGSGGSLQGSIEYLSGDLPDQDYQWRLDLDSESLPLSVVSLLRRRYPELAGSIPATVHGDTTGAVLISGSSSGQVEAAVRGLKVRNLTAANRGSRVWNNSLATVDGDLMLIGTRVIGRQLRATTDFASATIDGTFSRALSLVGEDDNPFRWLEAIDGTATAEIDLAAFDRSLPGVLPLRNEVQIVSGRALANIDSGGVTGSRQCRLNIRSESLRARSAGRLVVVDPIELAATVTIDRGQLRADRFEWKSMFGRAIGHGDLRNGSADFEIDFGRLMAMIRPIVRISESTLAGAARGNIRWNASPDNIWKLAGNGNATNLHITLPGGRALERSLLKADIEAVGRWGNQSLDQLSSATVTLSSNGLEIVSKLRQPVSRPSASTPFPVQVTGQGRVETLAETLGPWLPSSLHSAGGGFRLQAEAEVSAIASSLSRVLLDIEQPRVAYYERHFSQPRINVDFDGLYNWPSNDTQIRSLTVEGDAFSMRARGRATADQVDLEAKWLAKLERIQGSLRKRIASRPETPVQQVGYRTAVQTDNWLVMGDCGGSFKVRSQDQLLDVTINAEGTNFSIVQPAKASAGFRTVGPMLPGRNRSPRADNRGRVVWSEPNLKLDGRLLLDRQSGTVNADNMQIAGDWFATTLSGPVVWSDDVGNATLDGPARLKMDEVANRLSSLAGIDLRAEGIQETMLQIRANRQSDGNVGLSIRGHLGWEQVQVAGVTLGPTTVPVRLTETSVDFAPTRIPVGQGIVNLAGQFHYRPGTPWIRLQNGSTADSIRLTPEMTDRWLKYLAPLAADVAQIEGTIGAEIDEAVIVLEQPNQTRVSGRLRIGGAQMSAGPMAAQILTGIDQLQAFARALSAQPSPRVGHKLISMPAQTVEFAVEQGVVTHDRMFFEIDRAQVVTSGHVTLDGRLDMIAQVPLDARWLGRDLQGLAGQPVPLPIDGTLSRPSLDSSGIRRVVTEFGAQAIQTTTENYLQQQINRGLEKLLGR